MSSKRIAFKLNTQEAKYCLDFSNQIQVPLEQIAKVALLRQIDQSYREAARLQREQQGQQEATVAVTEPMEATNDQAVENADVVSPSDSAEESNG